MKKKIGFLKVVVIVIVALEIVVLAGCNTVNSTTSLNSSYDAIKTAYADDPSNSEIAFIYDAIHNQISEYPKSVPNFMNLPIDLLVDAIGADERTHIDYVNDENYENGIVIAQEPEAGADWDDGVIVNLTVNRKYSDINSIWGYMSESSGNLYLLYETNILKNSEQIWVDGEKLVDGEMIKLYVHDGNIYYNDRSAVYQLNGKSVSQVLGNYISNYAVANEKIYYAENTKLYCYNMNDETISLVFDESTMLFYVNSDYIVCCNPYDVFILDIKSYTLINAIHFENIITGFSLDQDNVYILEMEYISNAEENHKITKYNITQDTQTTIYDTNEMVSNIFAIDDKIVFLNYVDNQVGIRYIDMRSMENKFINIEADLTMSDDDVMDILFDGQQIIYETRDRRFYLICIFTGEIKEIG